MKKLLYIILICLFASSALGADCSVCSSGCDQTTIQACFDNNDFSGGDTIDITDSGTYREQVTWGSNDGGTSGNPVVLTSSGGAIINGATLDDGTGWSDQGGNVWRKNIGATDPETVVFDSINMGIQDATPDTDYEWTYSNPNLDVYSESNPGTYYTTIEYGTRGTCITVDAVDYVTIENIECRNSLYYGIHLDNGADYITIGPNVRSRFNGISGFQVYDSDHTADVTNLTIQDSQFDYNYSHGVSILDDADTVTITNITANNNSLEDCAVCSGVYIKSENANRMANVTIEKSLFYSNGVSSGGNGLYVDTLMGSSATIKHNKSHDNKKHGFVIEYQDSTTFIYNIAYNNNWGLSIWRQVDSTKVYNNTFEGNTVGIDLDAASEANTDANDFKNNSSSGNSVYEFSHTDGTNTIISDNCFGTEVTNFIEWEGSGYSTYSAWETAFGSSTSSIESDPLLDSNYVPLPGSPLIDAATVPNETSFQFGTWKDYTGNKNVFGSALDIGAIEHRGPRIPGLRFPLNIGVNCIKTNAACYDQP